MPYDYRDKPLLGALSNILFAANDMYSRILPEYRQKYAEFQEEKRRNQAAQQANLLELQGTEKYRQSQLEMDARKLEEAIRHNQAIENKPQAEKPLSKAQVEGQYLLKYLRQLEAEGRLDEYFNKGKKEKAESEIPAGIKTKAVEEFLDSRVTRNPQGFITDIPKFTPGTLDTLKSLGETMQYPPSPPVMQSNLGLLELLKRPKKGGYGPDGSFPTPEEYEEAKRMGIVK